MVPRGLSKPHHYLALTPVLLALAGALWALTAMTYNIVNSAPPIPLG